MSLLRKPRKEQFCYKFVIDFQSIVMCEKAKMIFRRDSGIKLFEKNKFGKDMIQRMNIV